MKESLIGSCSPGIPGKHTLQRPFISGRTSSFRPIQEVSEDSIGDVDDGEEVGEKEEDAASSEGDADADEEDNVPSHDHRPLGDLQKLFSEKEGESGSLVSFFNVYIQLSCQYFMFDALSFSQFPSICNADTFLDIKPASSLFCSFRSDS